MVCIICLSGGLNEFFKKEGRFSLPPPPPAMYGGLGVGVGANLDGESLFLAVPYCTVLVLCSFYLW